MIFSNLTECNRKHTISFSLLRKIAIFCLLFFLTLFFVTFLFCVFFIFLEIETFGTFGTISTSKIDTGVFAISVFLSFFFFSDTFFRYFSLLCFFLFLEIYRLFRPIFKMLELYPAITELNETKK